MTEENELEVGYQIIPSKPFANYADIEYLAVSARDRVTRVQVDICDGEYVKNISWPFTETSKSDFARLKDRPDLDVYMPSWEGLSYTADLMCLGPDKYIETLVAYGFDEIIVHFRSLKNQAELRSILQLCADFDLKLYLAVDLKSDLDEFVKLIKSLLDTKDNDYNQQFSGVQVMGIENIGLQGQEFDPNSLEIVKNIKLTFPELKILFDGGINEDNLGDIKNAGVEVFCVGHLITDGDFVSNLRFIKNILKNSN